MDIITDSVKKLEEMLRLSGCEDSGVRLDVNAGAVNCQYEKGACMIASFGGRSAEFTTRDPIHAQTKISFMFGAPLDTPATRSAACAIINVATGFFCLSRVLHACPQSSHSSCLGQLRNELAGNRVCFIGQLPALAAVLGRYAVADPEDADIILINGEGIIAGDTGAIISSYPASKRIICLGPSTAGVARLQNLEHWCPYGT
jgi:hypothetical protein